MLLFDALKCCDDDEVTVWDKDYDMEVYFYSDSIRDPQDLWDELMIDLAKKLVVAKQDDDGIVVNMGELIEKNIENINNADLFVRKIGLIGVMDWIHDIIAGYVSEKWLSDFVGALKSN